MTKYLYDLYLTNQKNNSNDLAIEGKAMLLHDARTGERMYTAEETDIKALHADYAELDAQMDSLLQFIGRHTQKLAAAFDLESRKEFDKVVEACIAEDKEAEEKAKQ